MFWKLTARSSVSVHPTPLERDPMPRDVCIYDMKKRRWDMKKPDSSFELGNKESSSHVGTYTITIRAKAENPDSKASPFCALKNLAPI